MAITYGEFSLDRMVNAVEKVRQRLLRSSAALEAAKVPYAILGGNAVALWVSRVDEGAVRNTKDVDILLRRQDFPAAKVALEKAGFVHYTMAEVEVFVDGPEPRARDAVHILFANEKVWDSSLAANPDVSESEPTGSYQVLNLEALVRTKLTAFRRKDQVHLLDMIEVGMIDVSWVNKYPPELGRRLQTLLDDPQG